VRIKRLPAFCDVGQQNIHKRVHAIERWASLIFGYNDSLDRREVVLAERVVLLAIKASSPSVRLFGIDPIVHDTPADEPSYLSIAIPAVQQQSITIVRAVVDSKLCKFHDRSPRGYERHGAYRLEVPSPMARRSNQLGEIGRQLSPLSTL
jgi:hypothetical protein